MDVETKKLKLVKQIYVPCMDLKSVLVTSSIAQNFEDLRRIENLKFGRLHEEIILMQLQIAIIRSEE
jgi:hypothetical protein